MGFVLFWVAFLVSVLAVTLIIAQVASSPTVAGVASLVMLPVGLCLGYKVAINYIMKSISKSGWANHPLERDGSHGGASR